MVSPAFPFPFYIWQVAPKRVHTTLFKYLIRCSHPIFNEDTHLMQINVYIDFPKTLHIQISAVQMLPSTPPLPPFKSMTRVLFTMFSAFFLLLLVWSCASCVSKLKYFGYLSFNGVCICLIICYNIHANWSTRSVL